MAEFLGNVAINLVGEALAQIPARVWLVILAVAVVAIGVAVALYA